MGFALQPVFKAYKGVGEVQVGHGELLLVMQGFTNEDGSIRILYSVTSDTTLYGNGITAPYQK